jgi:tetratricopeptide (TPR) repeat protein
MSLAPRSTWFESGVPFTADLCADCVRCAQQALEAAEKAHALRVELFGHNSEDTASSIWLLALLHKKKGNYEEALKQYYLALDQVSEELTTAGQLSCGLTECDYDSVLDSSQARAQSPDRGPVRQDDR